MAIVYILYSTNLDKFYIGHTTESMEERLRKNLSSHHGFTSKSKDWICVYQELYNSKSEAYQREVQIKKCKSRKRIIELIEGHNN